MPGVWQTTEGVSRCAKDPNNLRGGPTLSWEFCLQLLPPDTKDALKVHGTPWLATCHTSTFRQLWTHPQMGLASLTSSLFSLRNHKNKKP